MRKTITLLDLFSGIGGFHLGLEKAGFKIKSYNSEIDKHAQQVYKHNFKKSNYVGSVTDVRASELPRINAITFGSPCQDFSLAGKRKGMGGERSSLILEAIRLIEDCRPDFFIWENVKGTFSSNNRQDFAAILQAFANIGGYRIEWQLLNTKWFLPQNRERIYLVGYIGNRSRGSVFPIGKDVTKTDVVQEQTTNTLTARYQAKGTGSYIVENKFNAQIGTLRTHNDGFGFRQNKQDISPTIPAGARQDGSGQPVIKIKNGTKKGYDIAQEGDSINYSNLNSETRRGRVGKGVAQTLDTACSQGTIADSKIRRLTPLECERLQGFPDNWTQYGTEGIISDSQRYKMCGNAVTVNVVEAVGKQILKL
jgi:DNA (cytosine-5)-methyltransferase 1